MGSHAGPTRCSARVTFCRFCSAHRSRRAASASRLRPSAAWRRIECAWYLRTSRAAAARAHHWATVWCAEREFDARERAPRVADELRGARLLKPEVVGTLEIVFALLFGVLFVHDRTRGDRAALRAVVAVGGSVAVG